jgi:hypothetical protein
MVGQHHGVSLRYLYQYAQYAGEAGWKEDHRRLDNGRAFNPTLELALHHPVSRAWKGLLAASSVAKTARIRKNRLTTRINTQRNSGNPAQIVVASPDGRPQIQTAARQVHPRHSVPGCASA